MMSRAVLGQPSVIDAAIAAESVLVLLRKLVEIVRFGLTTSCLQSRRSTN